MPFLSTFSSPLLQLDCARHVTVTFSRSRTIRSSALNWRHFRARYGCGSTAYGLTVFLTIFSVQDLGGNTTPYCCAMDCMNSLAKEKKPFTVLAEKENIQRRRQWASPDRSETFRLPPRVMGVFDGQLNTQGALIADMAYSPMHMCIVAGGI